MSSGGAAPSARGALPPVSNARAAASRKNGARSRGPEDARRARRARRKMR